MLGSEEERTRQICGSGDTSETCCLSEVSDALLACEHFAKVHELVAGKCECCRLAQFTVWFTIWSETDTRSRMSRFDVVLVQKRRVDGGEMSTGVKNENRSGRRNRIEMMAVQPFAFEVNRIKSGRDEES